MPLPKSYQGVLQSASPELMEAATRAAAHLILHVSGYERLPRLDRDRYAQILRELLRAVRDDIAGVG